MTFDTNLIVGALFVAVLVVGFIRVLLRYKSRRERINFAVEYLNNYRKLVKPFLEKGLLDGETYSWLTYNSVKMQTQMGILGMVDYRPAFANYIRKNYQMLVNTLPQIRTPILHESDLTSLDDMMLRYIGWEEERIQSIKKQVYNPFAWLREGVQFVILLPLRILEWIGITGEGTTAKADNNRFIGFISALIGLFGIVGTVIGITVDWEQFLVIIKPFIGR